MVRYISKRHNWITSMENEITPLNTALFDTDYALYSTRQELSASRDFIAEEWSVAVTDCSCTNFIMLNSAQSNWRGPGLW